MKPVIKSEKGFTLVELVIVMAVIAVILSVVIPNLRGMQQESQLTKVEGELNTLKTAVTSYWRNHQNLYPTNVHTDLTGSVPQLIPAIIEDPFFTDTSTTPKTYGYLTGNDTSFGDYFAIYSKGPKADTTAPVWDGTNKKFTFDGSGRCASNAPCVHN